MLAYLNIRKLSPSTSMKNWWWLPGGIMRTYPSNTCIYPASIYRHHDVWRYMTVYIGISGCQDSRCLLMRSDLRYPIYSEPESESNLNLNISKLGSNYWLLLVLPPIIGNYWLLLQLLAILAIIVYYCFAKSFHIIGYYCDRLQH